MSTTLRPYASLLRSQRSHDADGVLIDRVCFCIAVAGLFDDAAFVRDLTLLFAKAQVRV